MEKRPSFLKFIENIDYDAHREIETMHCSWMILMSNISRLPEGVRVYKVKQRECRLKL